MFGIWKPQYRHSETYEELKAALSDMCAEAINLEVLTVGDGVSFFLEEIWSFWLLFVSGIQAATSEYSCIAQNINDGIWVLNGPLQIKQKGHALSKKSPKTVS